MWGWRASVLSLSVCLLCGVKPHKINMFWCQSNGRPCTVWLVDSARRAAWRMQRKISVQKLSFASSLVSLMRKQSAGYTRNMEPMPSPFGWSDAGSLPLRMGGLLWMTCHAQASPCSAILPKFSMSGKLCSKINDRLWGKSLDEQISVLDVLSRLWKVICLCSRSAHTGYPTGSQMPKNRLVSSAVKLRCAC